MRFVSTRKRFFFQAASVCIVIFLMTLYYKTGLAMSGYDAVTSLSGFGIAIIGLTCFFVVGGIGIVLIFGREVLPVLLSSVFLAVACSPFVSMIAFEAAK